MEYAIRTFGEPRARWAVPISGMLTHCLQSALVAFVPITLIGVIQDDLHLNTSQALLPINVFRLTQALLLVPIGIYVDTLASPRVPLLLALLCTAILGILFSFAPSLPYLVIYSILFSICFIFAGLMPMLLMLRDWFVYDRKDSFASGILLIGVSLAGVIAPPVISSLESSHGWRGTVQILTVAFTAIGLVPAFLFLRSRSEVDNVEPLASQKMNHSMSQRSVSFKAPARSESGKLPDHLIREREYHEYQEFPEDEEHTLLGTDDGEAPAQGLLRMSSAALLKRVSSLRPNSAEASALSLAAMSGGLDPEQSHSIFEREPAPPISASASHASSQEPASLKDLAQVSWTSVFTKQYVVILFLVACFSAGAHTVFDQLVLFARDVLMMDLETASFLLSAMNSMALTSKLISGYLGDRVSKPMLILFFACMSFVGSMMLYVEHLGSWRITNNMNMIICFILFYGASYGSIFQLTTAMLPSLGPSHLGLRSSLNLTVLFLAGSIGSIVSGILRTNTGSFSIAFTFCCVSSALMIPAALWLHMMVSEDRDLKV